MFFLIIILYVIFNGGNNNLLIQINFICISTLFLFSLKDKNYKSHLKYFYKKNKLFIFFYFLFLIFILFQIFPLPIESLRVFSRFKYEYLSLLEHDIKFISISLSRSTKLYLSFLARFLPIVDLPTPIMPVKMRFLFNLISYLKFDFS